eukprot:106829_1
MIPLIFSSLACMIISQIIFTIQSTINMQQSHQYQCICPIKSYTNHILRSSACMVCLTELRDQGAPGSIFDGKGEFRLRFIELLDDIAPNNPYSIQWADLLFEDYTNFSMTTPIANLTPVHIPFMPQNTNNTMNGQSPMNSFFFSITNKL